MYKRIQYCGSLFVDSYEKVIGAHFLKPVAPILLLNGNIGRLSSYKTHDFLRHCSRLWDSVIYVPGPYELAEYPLPCINLSNVHLLNNKTIHINNMNFLVSPYASLNDRNWLLSEFIHSLRTRKGDKIIAVTHGIPSFKMLHSRDIDDYVYNESLEDYILPNVDAWVSGYSYGSKSMISRNGVYACYNTRGHIAYKNDFSGYEGWSREAYLDFSHLQKLRSLTSY
jgi:hypothetical protein